MDGEAMQRVATRMSPKCKLLTQMKGENMSAYPLYDVPWLVRPSNGSYMSLTRHRLEVRNQAIVDAYFIERGKGMSAPRAKKMVAQKNAISVDRVRHCLRWYYQEAERRKRYDFLIKFPPAKEHIVHY